MKKLALLFLSLFFATGCATTHSAIKADTSFPKYHKVYMADAEVDPRKVGPKVKQRF